MKEEPTGLAQARIAGPFDTPQFLILNVAVDSDCGSDVDDANFLAHMEIEHVRVREGQLAARTASAVSLMIGTAYSRANGAGRQSTHC